MISEDDDGFDIAVDLNPGINTGCIVALLACAAFWVVTIAAAVQMFR